MHEASLARELLDIIERVAEDNGALRVTRARLALGELSCAEPHALQFAFEIMRKDSIAAGCELVIEREPIVVRCESCGHEGPCPRQKLECPACNGVPVEVVSGRDMRLVSIDVEDSDDAASA
jgi:hydrogenase nickel incorporation protein HypA/HybF